RDRQECLSHLCGAVAFFVFFAGAARTWIVAADFGSGTDSLWWLRFRGARLILQIFLLALLFAFDLPGDFRETLRWLRGACGSAGGRRLRALRFGPGL